MKRNGPCRDATSAYQSDLLLPLLLLLVLLLLLPLPVYRALMYCATCFRHLERRIGVVV